jgi:hypothetical protein
MSLNEKPSVEEIKHKFKGKLITKRNIQNLVCSTLQIFPNPIIDFITENVWFVSSLEDAWGFTFKGDDLKGKYLIFLSEELFEEPVSQSEYTIAHEIGHVMLKHRNAILEYQSKREIEDQEREADQFARKYLENY